MTTDCLLVGHVTVDHYPDGERPGGSVWYGARALTGLGATPRLITAAGPDFPVSIEWPAQVQAAAQTTRFTNRYHGGQTHQQLQAQAGPLSYSDDIAPTDLLFLAPVLGEVDAQEWLCAPARFRGVGLQGWLKKALNGVVDQSPSGVDPKQFRGADAAVLSIEDLAGDLDWLDQLCRIVPNVVLTRGADGCTVFTQDTVSRVPAFPAHAVDPTGAGDTFAAAFFYGVLNGMAPDRAARYAAQAAAIVVEWVGPAPAEAMGNPRFQVTGGMTQVA